MYDEYFDKFYELKNRSASVTKGNERRATRTWFSLTNDPLVCTRMVEEHFVSKTGIVVGSAYQTAYITDPTCRALSWSTRDRGAKDGKEFETTIQYGRMDSTDNGQDPLDVRVEFNCNFSLQNKIINTDIWGQAIRNPVGDVFDPPLEEGYPFLVQQWKRNEPSFNRNLASMMTGSVNLDWWMGFPPLTCHIRHLGATSATSQNYPDYFKTTYQVETNNDRWVRKILSTGLYFNEYDDEGVFIKKSRISIGGQSVTVPQEIDAMGRRIFTGDPPHWLYFHTKRLMPFSPVLNF